jgi:hypothetical protein
LARGNRHRRRDGGGAQELAPVQLRVLFHNYGSLVAGTEPKASSRSLQAAHEVALSRGLSSNWTQWTASGHPGGQNRVKTGARGLWHGSSLGGVDTVKESAQGFKGCHGSKESRFEAMAEVQNAAAERDTSRRELRVLAAAPQGDGLDSTGHDQPPLAARAGSQSRPSRIVPIEFVDSASERAVFTVLVHKCAPRKSTNSPFCSVNAKPARMRPRASTSRRQAARIKVQELI